MAPSGHFAQTAISWGSKTALTIPWQAPTSSSGCTLAGHWWELGGYLKEILLWVFFIHIPFLRHWVLGMGLKDWRAFLPKLKAILMRKNSAMARLGPGRYWVFPSPTAQTWSWSPKRPVQSQLNFGGTRAALLWVSVWQSDHTHRSCHFTFRATYSQRANNRW